MKKLTHKTNYMRKEEERVIRAAMLLYRVTFSGSDEYRFGSRRLAEEALLRACAILDKRAKP